MPLASVQDASRLYSGNNDGGLTVTQEMRDILAQSGFIKTKSGGQRLRMLYVNESINFDAMRLSRFGLSCFIGDIHTVRQEVEAGRAPDLEATETAFKFGYATITVSGAQRVQPNALTKHTDVLEYLGSRGLPLNVPDIAGLTALHHVLTADQLSTSVFRALLKAGADVNFQNRYGEVPLFSAYMKSHLTAIDLLMEFGADLDISEADGLTPRKSMLLFGPEITATVQKWIRRREGQEAPRTEKCCDDCGRKDATLKNCGKCQVARYCSIECQRKAWPEHKKTCQPFSTSNTLTFKPYYEQGQKLMPMQDLQKKYFGLNNPTPETHYRSSHVPKSVRSESKNIVIKVQIPFDRITNKPIPGAGPFLVYTKKRDFVSYIRRSDGPAAYDRLLKVILEKGVGSSKAYFVAELKSKDELIVKVSEVVAEQPF